MTHQRVALITGASSGIGAALAVELARQGWAVGIMARRRELLEQLHSTITSNGGVCAWAVADVAHRQEVNSAVASLTASLGAVELLVANAGIGGPTKLDPLNVVDIEKVFQVNFFGVVYAIEAVLPSMLARGQGHLAAVSSMAAYKGMSGQESYSASKAALNNFLEGLRLHLHGKGVAVTTICPGFIWTPMTEKHRFKMPFLIQADDAARRIIRALQRRKKVFDFPRRMRLVMRLAGWAPDWLVARVFKNNIKFE